MQENNIQEIIKEAEVSETNNWKATFKLPKYDENGKRITYQVDEKQVPEGYTKYIEGNKITNTLINYNILTINHIDKTTGEILETEEKRGLEAEKITTKAKDIPFYKIIEKPETEEYTLTKEPQTVNYYYLRISEGIIEKHINSITNELLEDEILHEGYEGDKYTTHPKEFKDYKLDETKMPPKPEGIFTKEPIEIIYYYIPKAGIVTINHIDQITGEKITKSTTIEGWVGENYKTKPQQFKNYELSEKLPLNATGTLTQENIEINYYYIYKSKITINRIDKETGEKLKQETKTIHEGEKIEVKEIEIPYYKLEEKPETEKYTITKNPIEVTYKYRKLKFNIKIEQTIEKIILNQKENKVEGTIYKLEIPKKQSENNIQVHYKIKVTNNSEITGNTEIVSYIPEGYKALQKDNPNWNINENKASKTVEKLKIGETQEYTLILTNNDKTKIGTITNKVIAENSTNEAGFSETTLEDNQSTTEFVTSISTGLENNIKETLYKILIILTLLTIALFIIKIIKQHKNNNK